MENEDGQTCVLKKNGRCEDNLSCSVIGEISVLLCILHDDFTTFMASIALTIDFFVKEQHLM